MQNDKIRGSDDKSVNSHKDFKDIRSARGSKSRDIGFENTTFLFLTFMTLLIIPKCTLLYKGHMH